jgi:hypothetical protein
MNNNDKQASDGEAKAKPEVIKLGLDLHARQVTECRILNWALETARTLDGTARSRGHLPFLGKLVSLLVTGSEENEIVEFHFGSVVCIERRDDGRWKVAWMITPTLLHG